MAPLQRRGREEGAMSEVFVTEEGGLAPCLCKEG